MGVIDTGLGFSRWHHLLSARLEKVLNIIVVSGKQFTKGPLLRRVPRSYQLL